MESEVDRRTRLNLVRFAGRGPVAAKARWRRRIHKGVALSFQLLGVVAAIPSLGLAVMLGLLMVQQGGSGSAEPVIKLGLLGVVACGFILFGGFLGRRTRYLVLYLRRFGFAESHETVSRAAIRALGATYRLVTLDDSQAQPRGDAQSRRRLATWVGRVAGVALVLFVGTVAWDMVQGDFGPGMLLGDSPASDNPVAALFVQFVLVLVSVLTFFVALAVLAMLAGLLMVFFGAAWLSSRALERAELTKVVAVSEARDVGRLVQRVARNKRREFAPRLTVARVADPIWKDVVHAFAEDADLVLVDISQPTEALVWEMETLRELGAACVYIVEEDAAAELERAAVAEESEDRTPRRGGVLDRFFSLLGDAPVLAYGPEEDPAAFAARLRVQLDNALAE